jgi:hypothetical protein
MNHAISIFLVSFLAASCDGVNSSSASADYDTVTVKHLALSDAAGRTVVTVTADRTSDGRPLLVLRNPDGSVLKTVEIELSVPQRQQK